MIPKIDINEIEKYYIAIEDLLAKMSIALREKNITIIDTGDLLDKYKK